MYTLQLMWQFIEFSTLLGWHQDNVDRKEFYEVATESLRVLFIVKVSDSRVWPLWLILLYLMLPVGFIYFAGKEMIHEMRS